MTKERRIIAIVLAGMVLLSLAVVANAWPDDQDASQVTDSPTNDAPVVVLINLESIDAARGSVHLSVQAFGDPAALGDAGATVYTSIAGIGPIFVPQPDFSTPRTADAPVDGGDVSQYPFDRYPLELAIAAYPGPPTTPANIDVDDLGEPLPISISVTSSLSGFGATADPPVFENGFVAVDIELDRLEPTVAWAVAMMVIYWLLATSALAVAVAVLTGVRPFETRHLAWLTAMIFAFAAFRNTAPGSPPIGVFLDFASFFWAVGIVVVAELLILGYYLFRTDVPDP